MSCLIYYNIFMLFVPATRPFGDIFFLGGFPVHTG